MTSLKDVNGVYHLKCLNTWHNSWRKKNDPAMDILLDNLKDSSKNGHILECEQVWENYVKLCEDNNHKVPASFESRRSTFKERLSDRISSFYTFHKVDKCGDYKRRTLLVPVGIKSQSFMNSIHDNFVDEDDDIKLAPCNDSDNIMHVIRASLYLRKVIQEHSVNTKTYPTEENTYSAVPEALYTHMALMHGGSDILDVDGDDGEDARCKAETFRKKILDICQDIVFSVTDGKNIPPKQFSIPMTMHHLTRSKKAVQLVNKAMPSMSYKKVLQADNAIAVDALKSLDLRTGAVVPQNLIHGRPVRFGTDNLDAKKESLIVGHSAGFHGTQTVAYQPGPAAAVDDPEMVFCNEVPNIPDSLHTVLELVLPIKKDPPYVISEQDVNTILDHENGLGNAAYNTAVAKDMAFILFRSRTNRYCDQKSNWTYFNKYLHKEENKSASIVGQTPILNAKSDAHNTIYTVGERGKVIANTLGQKHVLFTVDQGIHGPAMEVKFPLDEYWHNVHFRLGGFQIGGSEQRV